MYRRIGPALSTLTTLCVLWPWLPAGPAFAQDAPPPAVQTHVRPADSGLSADAEAEPKSVLDKSAPENVSDLRDLESRVGKLIERVTECTVAIRTDESEGSGVIVSEEGYVLTAAHVAGAPGRSVIVVLSDGKRVKGRTLGLMHGLDAALIKITAEGHWTFAEMAGGRDVSMGDWCLATGHPGGYLAGRKPVVRLGRVTLITPQVVQSDCTLVGGDSGGPLFNMQGQVIGVHSRIGAVNTWNFHVPVAVYRQSWDELVASREWTQFSPSGHAVLGIDGDDHELGCRIKKVVAGYPAAEAKLQVDDVIVQFDGKTFDRFDTLRQLIASKKPGDSVELEIRRGAETIVTSIVLGKRRASW